MAKMYTELARAETIDIGLGLRIKIRHREQLLTEIVYIHYKVSCLGPRQGNWTKPSLDPTEIQQTDTTISWNAGRTGLGLESAEISSSEETESVLTSTTAVNKSQFTLGRRVYISQSEHLTDSKEMLT